MVLLDTTVLIDALRARPSATVLLAELVEGGHTLATTSINLGEVYAGMRALEEVRTDDFLSGLICLPLSKVIARKAGMLKRAFALQGRTLSLIDMVIAATALEYEIALMTGNRKDFPLAELKFYPAEEPQSSKR